MMDFLSKKPNDIVYTVILVGLTTIILVYLIWDRLRGRKLPPGPTCLPIVGFLPFLTRKPYIKLQELKKKYGPIFSLRLGSRYVVVLGDYKSIKDAFAQDAFIGRPLDSTIEQNKETLELGALSGIKWKEQRRFTLKMLRDLGFHKETMERHIREEIIELLERLTKEIGHPITISKFLTPSMSNNVASLVFGKRRSFEDPKRKMLDQVLKEIAEVVGQVAWQSFFPWLRAATMFFGFNKRSANAFEKIQDFCRTEVQEHEETLNANNIRDFVDGYLLEMQKHKNDPDTTFLKPVLCDLAIFLFGAGSETVQTTLNWLLLISASWPHVQKKVQSEIDDVIGKNRFPNRADAKLMPFTEAVISELWRWKSVVPINLLRYTLEDTQLGSYFIPKDSYVIANLWGVLHDPELWGNDVDDFRPERFLSSDGKSVSKPDYHIPFSIGKRQCPGESLAFFEVFLYYTTILQKFDASLPKGATPDFEGKLGLTLQAKPYELILKPR